MTQSTQIEPELCSPVSLFTIRTVLSADVMTVYVTGELGLNGHAETSAALLGGHGHSIVVDMVDLDFMDCAGYRSIAQARRNATEHAKSFKLINAHGGPARLLAILDEAGLL